jgi:hypothetical protein
MLSASALTGYANLPAYRPSIPSAVIYALLTAGEETASAGATFAALPMR